VPDDAASAMPMMMTTPAVFWFTRASLFDAWPRRRLRAVPAELPVRILLRSRRSAVASVSPCRTLTERRRHALPRKVGISGDFFGGRGTPGRPTIVVGRRAADGTDGGTPRPSALAVLRLITSPHLVGARTGRSAGFLPYLR